MGAARTLEKKSYCSALLTSPVLLAVEHTAHTSTQADAAARCLCFYVLSASSREGKITVGSAHGNEKSGGTVGTMRLLGHESWVQVLLTDGVR